MNKQQPYRIQVTGESTVSVPADQALILLGVETESINLGEAQSENTRAMSSVITALHSLGISNEKIETTNYQINSEYDFVDGKQQFRAFKVLHTIRVTIDQLDLAGAVVDTAVRNGANTVSSLQFTVRDVGEFYNQALAQAIHNGDHKAATIAKAANVQLDPIPIEIEELPPATQPIPYAASFLAETEATPLQRGTTLVKAAVKIVYRYE